MNFNQAHVVKQISSFKKGSAPGPSGLRPEHLKAVIKSVAPNRTDRASEAITKVVNVMASGSVPDVVRPFLFGARLHAALKKDGGLRPIAIGNLLRRLCSNCFSFATADRSAAKLAPNQLGIGLGEAWRPLSTQSGSWWRRETRTWLSSRWT